MALLFTGSAKHQYLHISNVGHISFFLSAKTFDNIFDGGS